MAYVRNVERGDSLVLSSAEHNRIANAVNVNNAPSFVSPHESSRQYSFLMLSNGTSDTIPAFRFVEIKTTGSSTYIVPFVRNTSGETAVNRSIGYTYDNIMPGNRGMVIVSGVFNIFCCIDSFGSVEYDENAGLKYAYAINSVEYVISDGTDIEDKYKEIRKASWKRKIAEAFGKVNSDKFKGWEPGEVMFLGASYTAPERGNEIVTVTYSFSIRVNESNVEVFGHKVDSLPGHDVIWAGWTERVSASGPSSTRLKFIMAARVCKRYNFDAFGLGD